MGDPANTQKDDKNYRDACFLQKVAVDSDHHGNWSLSIAKYREAAKLFGSVSGAASPARKKNAEIAMCDALERAEVLKSRFQYKMAMMNLGRIP